MGIMATTVRDTGRQHLRWMGGLRCALMSNPTWVSNCVALTGRGDCSHGIQVSPRCSRTGSRRRTKRQLANCCRWLWLRSGPQLDHQPAPNAETRTPHSRPAPGSIDIVNSQPALLALLIHNTDSSIHDRHTFTPKVGVVGYNQLATSGRLYEHLMEWTGLSRREVKVGLLHACPASRRPALLFH